MQQGHVADFLLWPTICKQVDTEWQEGVRELHGLWLSVGNWPNIGSQNSKGAEILCHIGQQFSPGIGNTKVYGKRFGLADSLIFQSQLAGWGGGVGRGGSVANVSHSFTLYTTWHRWRELRSLPLVGHAVQSLLTIIVTKEVQQTSVKILFVFLNIWWPMPLFYNY